MFRPIVWIAAVFAFGMVLDRAVPLSAWMWVLAGGGCLAAAVLLYVLEVPAVLPLAAGIACAGALLYLMDARPPPTDPFAQLDGAHVTLTGVVVQPPQVREDRTTLVARVETIARGPQERQIRGRVVISLRGQADAHYGDRIRTRGRLLLPPAAGNPGEISYREHLRAQGIAATLYPGRFGSLRVIDRGHGSAVLAAVFGIRERVLRLFTAALPGERGALLSSLLLGDDGAITPETRTAFRRAGLLHLLVVSGAQVGLVAAAVIWLTRRLRATAALAAAASVPAVVVFALMVGWAPSVGRAVVMAVAASAAVISRRAYDAAAALAAASIVLLGSSPLLLFDPGFQLSFAATWGLIYLAPALRERLLRLPRPAAVLVGATSAAQIAVLPVLAYHFQQVSIAGFAANLVVVPLVALLVPVGFGAAAVGLLIPPLAAPVAWLLRPLLDAVGYLARVFAAAPGAAVTVYPPGLLTIAACYALMILAAEVLRGRIRLRIPAILAGATVLLAVVLWARVLDPAASHRLTLTILDVGQGDAIVAQGPSGQTVLVDAGGEVEGHLTGYDVGARRVVPALRRLGVRMIDVVILSHPHEDHVGGLVAVLQNFRVGLVLDPGLKHPAPSYARVLQLVQTRAIPYRLARRGMHLDLGDGLQLAVLRPEEPLITGSGSDPNLNSVVARLTYGEVGVLLTGDMEALNESQLLELGDDVRSAVLKVAHHGSETGTTEAFVGAVRPLIAVISVGAHNPFGHPDPETVATLEEWGAQVYRTDRDGAVILATDGRRIRVHTVRH